MRVLAARMVDRRGMEALNARGPVHGISLGAAATATATARSWVLCSIAYRGWFHRAHDFYATIDSGLQDNTSQVLQPCFRCSFFIGRFLFRGNDRSFHRIVSTSIPAGVPVFSIPFVPLYILLNLFRRRFAVLESVPYRLRIHRFPIVLVFIVRVSRGDRSSHSFAAMHATRDRIPQAEDREGDNRGRRDRIIRKWNQIVGFKYQSARKVSGRWGPLRTKYRFNFVN